MVTRDGARGRSRRHVPCLVARAVTPPGPARSLKILVADDEQEMRALVADTLRADGHVVQEAGDGEDVLAQLDDALVDPRARPDLVLMDVRMPGLSGLGVLLALHRAQVHLPVVLMTALTDKSVDTVAKRLGAGSVLRKPFGPEDLRTAVASAVAKRGA